MSAYRPFSPRISLELNNYVESAAAHEGQAKGIANSHSLHGNPERAAFWTLEAEAWEARLQRRIGSALIDGRQVEGNADYVRDRTYESFLVEPAKPSYPPVAAR